MNDVEVLTKNITIIVQLDGYDYDNPEDFDVIIEAGNNATSTFTITKHQVLQHSSKKGTYNIFQELLYYFTLDNLKITCKYPVVVKCADFIISKYIEPTTDNKRTQATLTNGAGDSFELEGTVKQIEAFESIRKKRNDALFPSCMSFIETVRLALEHGLTIKKITTRK